MKNKELRIGNLTATVPVMQGGMGVGISLSSLAGNVAKCGGIGMISTAQIGYRKEDFKKNPIPCNLEAVQEEIHKAREIAGGAGILGVNIMVVTREYKSYVEAAVEAGIDLIISGAGLPMELPELVEGTETKIGPIVSSKKALMVITRYWLKKYNRLPDVVVIEGPKAGGHLGFSREELDTFTKESYDEEIKSIIQYSAELSEKNHVSIPVIVAGGIYTREDLDHYKAMGAAGVQMGTRFVTTEECDASLAYKNAYIEAKEEDIVIVKSPVGLPGRAINNAFLKKVQAGERFMRGCRQCITTCNPATAPYCITEALINAVEGNLDEGLLFCGSNAYRATKLETVSAIMEEFR